MHRCVGDRQREADGAGVADRGSGDQGCCLLAPLTQEQPIKKRRTLQLVCDSENHRSKTALIEAQRGLAGCWAQKGSQITAASPRYYKQRPPPTKTRLSSFSVFPLNTTTNEYPPTTATTFRLRSQSSTDTHPSSYSFNTLHQFHQHAS